MNHNKAPAITFRQPSPLEVIRSICTEGEMLFVERSFPITREEALRRVSPVVWRVFHIHGLLAAHPSTRRTPVRILEVGLGYGYIAFSLASLLSGAAVSSVEHPKRAYLTLPSFAEAVRRYQIELKLGDIVEDPLDWPDDYFDVVIFSEVIEHLPPTRVSFVLSQLVRVLRQDGIVVCSSNNLASLMHRVHLMRGKSMLDIASPLDYAGGTYGHIRLYTVNELRTMAQLHGLEAARIDFTNWHMHSLMKGNSGIRLLVMKAILLMEDILARLGRPGFREGWCVLFEKTNCGR